MEEYKIKMDLCEDYSRLIRKLMEVEGITTEKTGFDLWCDYFNLLKKHILPKKRNVLFSKEFVCPPKEIRGLELLVDKFEKGLDVTQHLSRRAIVPEEFDGLLYDWGIYHLHLGEDVDEETGFMDRTKYVLFAKVDEENVYCINIYPHGKGVVQPWTKQEMIKILHDNWPEVMHRYRVPGAAEMTEHLSDVEYAKARKNNLNVGIEVEKGTVYLPPGGGYTSSGHSTEVIMRSQRINKALIMTELRVRENVKHIVADIEDCTGEVVDYELEFTLLGKDNSLFVLEKNSKVIVMQVF